MTSKEWQDLVNEFGDDAFKRIGVTFMGEGIGYSNPECNCHVEFYGSPLRSLQELFKLDVETYGDNAYLMWLFGIDIADYGNNPEANPIIESFTAENNDDARESFLKADCYKRKQSAALPFDINRAQNGDAVQVFINAELIDMDYKNFRPVGDWDNFSFKFPEDLRMKYPPRLDNENR